MNPSKKYDADGLHDGGAHQREERRVEEALFIFKESLDNASDAIGISTPQGRHYYQNKAFDAWFGDIGENPPETLYVDRGVGREVFKTIMAGKSWLGEVQMYGRDRRILDILLRAYANEDANGNVTALVGIHTDITERKRMEEPLRERERMYRLMADNSKDMISRHAPDGTVQYVSPACEAITGYTQEELLAKPANIILLPEEEPHIWEVIRRRQETASFYSVEHRIRRKDGSIIWVEALGQFIRDSNGAVQEIQCNVRDITERKRVQQQLMETNRRLEEETARANRHAASEEKANQAKSRFLANMSHEIRTPLNAIIGFAQILARDTGLSEKQATQVNAILRSGEHLLALINEILSLSRIEARRVELHTEVFSLRTLLEDLGTMFTHTANEKGVSFEMECAEDVPNYIVADAAKLRQVLINLLGNAVKFTEHGTILLRVKAATPGPETSDEPMRLIVEVKDSGIGIPEGDMEHIFDTFWQSEQGMRAGGAGLGLVIANHIATLMGGTITAESRVGAGSVFTFEIPITIAPDAQPTESSEEKSASGGGEATKAEPRRILIVDDQKDMRALLRDLLVAEGYLLKEAENGEEALVQFEAWGPDLVLMDMRMPVMNGHEAIKRIKETERGRRTPVIAVTAGAFEEDRKTAMETGADGFISKPFRLREVLDALHQALK